MNGEITDYVAGRWLALFTPSWFSLHSFNPAFGGHLETELLGGSYARQSGSWTLTANRTLWLATKLVFVGLPAARITHVGTWDRATNGNMTSFCELIPPGHDVSQGGSFQLDPDTYAISIGVPA